ncbi:crotonobetainyl-CoA:carnitine CoA-transferase CaiB-like acyl-CoA transferase [Caldalkalibacillus uzonensis]|uniref:Crotonobetainyl-CoA:carnitine CoA-transferase CaiB-like acyl-CoA transferase n=1 Tax=Caldalkalibacillus uzonensis TaxID=353224 RepID=A0ABU0CY71_9BACI|nr:CoA transferase [Caldalkalibacillus uzonensis]MDQ0341082.1 crotonobetainyl-CoA:carnitine CoA-transferase CaiB-like acyl-CoA transferase [Caldalkalibacillus uzonensis]
MNLPLSSIRILDLTRLLPGPYCTMLLADFGAEVIKIEDPSTGDYARWYEPKQGEDSAMFVSLNRNKKSLSLNLKSDQGKDIFLQLVLTADVVVESFRPGVMERLGLGYGALAELNPKLIYCAVTGYGQDGPYSTFPGHDINYLSYTGLLDLQGERGGRPVMPVVQIADIGGGALMAAVGILLALQARTQTQKGQFVDISMMDGVVSWMQTILPNYLATGQLPQRGESVLAGGRACYGVYQTADQRYLSIGALEPKFWETFCRVIERPDLIPRLEAPLDDQEKMKIEISSIIKTRTLSEWLAAFKDQEACVSPVHNLKEVLEDRQIKYRQMIVDVEHHTLGKIQQPGIPIKMSATGGSIRMPAPSLGEHTKELLAELGFTEQQMQQLKKENII